MIIGFKGLSDTGLYPERAVDGTLADYMLESERPNPSAKQRLV